MRGAAEKRAALLRSLRERTAITLSLMDLGAYSEKEAKKKEREGLSELLERGGAPSHDRA